MQTDSGEFVPAWMEPKHFIIERDDDMIAELIEVSHRFVTDFNNYKELENTRG
jgi:hypothetical protein